MFSDVGDDTFMEFVHYANELVRIPIVCHHLPQTFLADSFALADLLLGLQTPSIDQNFVLGIFLGAVGQQIPCHWSCGDF